MTCLTLESMLQFMSEHEGRILVFNDEAARFKAMQNQYKSGGTGEDAELWMECQVRCAPRRALAPRAAARADFAAAARAQNGCLIRVIRKGPGPAATKSKPKKKAAQGDDLRAGPRRRVCSARGAKRRYRRLQSSAT